MAKEADIVEVVVVEAKDESKSAAEAKSARS